MDSRIFDNIQVTSLLSLLDEHLTLKRFYPLIPYKERIVLTLLSLEINDKYEYWEASQELRDEFVQKTDLGLPMEAVFVQFLHLYDFKPRRISDSAEIGFHIEQTGNKTMKSSEDYLRYCINNGIEDAAKVLQVSANCAHELFCLCDLMRLPGVKWLRAKIYYDSGYQSVQSFSQQSKEQMRNKIALYIQSHCAERAVPLPKEIATQIAVAGALPYLYVC